MAEFLLDYLSFELYEALKKPFLAEVSALYFPTSGLEGRDLQWSTSVLLGTTLSTGPLYEPGGKFACLWPAVLWDSRVPSAVTAARIFPSDGLQAFTYLVICRVVFEDLVHAKHCSQWWEHGSKQKDENPHCRGVDVQPCR